MPHFREVTEEHPHTLDSMKITQLLVYALAISCWTLCFRSRLHLWVSWHGDFSHHTQILLGVISAFPIFFSVMWRWNNLFLEVAYFVCGSFWEACLSCPTTLVLTSAYGNGQWSTKNKDSWTSRSAYAWELCALQGFVHKEYFSWVGVLISCSGEFEF